MTCATTVIVRRPHWQGHWQTEHQLMLSLQPNIDWANTQRVRAYLQHQAGLEAVICDCALVDITSTAAIGWLITLYRWCLRQGLCFRLENVPLRAQISYRSQGLDAVFPIAA